MPTGPGLPRPGDAVNGEVIELPIFRDYDPQRHVGSVRIRRDAFVDVGDVMALSFKVLKAVHEGEGRVRVTEFEPVCVGLFADSQLARTGAYLQPNHAKHWEENQTVGNETTGVERICR